MPTDVYSLQLQDDFSQPAKKVDKSISRLQSLFGSLTSTAKRLTSGIAGLGRTSGTSALAVTKLANATDKGGKSAKGLSGILSSFGGSRLLGGIQNLAGGFGELIPAIGGLGPVAGAALAAVAAVGVAAFKIGSSISTLSDFRGELIGIVGSGAAADKTLEAIRKTALETGNSFAETGKLFIQSLRMGFTEADSKFLVVLNDRLSDLNQSQPEAVADAMTALQKSLTSGKFDTRMFNALTKVGINTDEVLKNLSKQTGKSIKDVMKGLNEGTISVAQFGAAFAKVTNAMPEAEKGIGAQFSELGGIIENQLIIPIAQKALPVVLEFTKTLISGFRTAADFIEKNGATIVSTLKGVGIVLGVLAAGFVAMNIVAIAAWAAAFLPVTAVVAAIGLVGYAIGQLIENWGEVKAWAAGVWASVTGFFSQLVTDVKAIWEGFSLADVGKNLVLGLVSGITGAAGMALDSIKNLAGDLIGTAADALGIKSPSKEFEYQGKMVDEGLALGIDRHDDLVMKSAQDVTDMAIMESEASFKPASGGSSMENVSAQAGSSMNAQGSGSGGGAVNAPVSVSINIDGSGSPEQTMKLVKSYFEEEFALFFERNLEGAGA